MRTRGGETPVLQRLEVALDRRRTHTESLPRSHTPGVPPHTNHRDGHPLVFTGVPTVEGNTNPLLDGLDFAVEFEGFYSLRSQLDAPALAFFGCGEGLASAQRAS